MNVLALGTDCRHPTTEHLVKKRVDYWHNSIPHAISLHFVSKLAPVDLKANSNTFAQTGWSMYAEPDDLLQICLDRSSAG